MWTANLTGHMSSTGCPASGVPQMPSVPMKIGMYLFPRMLTSKSTPVVVTIGPERLTVASADQLLVDASPAQLRVKPSKVSGAITLLAPDSKIILAALGSNSAAAFSAEQEEEIRSAQQIAAQDPEASQLELAQTLWVGRPVTADGTYQGAIRSMKEGDGGHQRRVGGIVEDALLAVGVQPA